MTIPVISSTIAAILIILQQLLMINVGMHRAKTSIGVGFGDDMNLERKIRRHGNLAENSALFLATLTLAELRGAPSNIIIGFGGVFVFVRLMHIIAFSSNAGSHLAKGSKLFSLLRAVGAFGTFFTGLALGGFLLFTIAA